MVASVVLVTLGGCGGQSAGTRPKPAAPKIRVRLTADSHRPQVGKPWHYEVHVTDAGGSPVPATVHLQILFNGAPVGQIGRHRVADGIWSETIGTGPNPPFPARARGVPLVFEAVAKARGQVRRVRYPIRVR
jgi:hypothetical protein